MDNKFWRGNDRVLVAFDMDKTIIDCECLDEVAKSVGCYEKVSSLTEQAMCGKITFEESIKERLSLLKGLHVNNFDKVFKEFPVTDEARALVARLKREGAKTAIITGSFDVIVHRHARKMEIDYIASNKLEVRNGMLTGAFEMAVDGNKGYWLDYFREVSGATIVVGVGDGANDIPMLRASDIGIAFRAKECLRGIADVNVDNLLEVYNILDDLLDKSQRTNINTTIELI
ncbi:MAG: phosphoserine phosphatase SerB [Candidatus Methanofastidiosia archaeon]